MQELPPEMSLLLAKVTEQLNLQTTTIMENITTAIMQKVDDKIKPIMEENVRLKNELEVLNKKILNLEVNSRRNNIVIHGIPEACEEKHEDLATVVMSTLKAIEVEIDKSEIVRLQRLGKKIDKGAKTRPILLATTTLERKIQILKNKRKMKTNTYITHDLPKVILQSRKENTHENNETNNKELEKRKRSETPSPSNHNHNHSQSIISAKIHKKDAFQYLRERSHNLSEKSTCKN